MVKNTYKVVSFTVDGQPYSSICRPKHFTQDSLKTTAKKNSKYNTKRDREILFKSNV